MTTMPLSSDPLRLSGALAVAKEPDVFIMPCAVSQHRFWLLDQLYSGNSALNIPLALQFTGPLDIGVLERALNAIVARHEILRTSFAVVDGEPMQVIKPAVHLQMGVVNLGEVPADKRQERVDLEMIAEAARPLSPAKAPIFRTVLLRLGPEDNVLMMTLQHIVCDGWSNGLLVREVGLFYDALLRDKPVDLVPLTLQYADYAMWQKEWLATPQFQQQLAYWEQALEGDMPVLDLPTDYPRQIGQDYTAYIESLLLPASLTETLKRLCVELDMTLFMVLFATYVTLLYRYTGQKEFLVGTTAANRNRSELEHLIGLFANPLILRPQIAEDCTFRELATQLRDHALNGFAHQEVPFEIILEKMQERKSGTRKPVIQTHFLFQKAFMESARYGDLSIKPLRSVSPGSTFELTYGIVERPEGIRLQMEYHTALFKNSTIKRMLGHFRRLLEAAVENPDTPVSEMTLLTNAELEALELPPLPPVATPMDSADMKPVPSANSALAKSGGLTKSGMLTKSGALTKSGTLGALAKMSALAKSGSLALSPDAAVAKSTSDPLMMLLELRGDLDKHLSDAIYPRGAAIHPRPGVDLVVLDSHLRLVPIGVPGEVYLAGFSDVPAGREIVTGPLDSATPVPLVRTEFVGQHREDGRVELLGKKEDFARVNGFRVNLRQVEAFLARHPGILEAAATVFKQSTGENHLVCFIVPKLGAAPVEKDLRLFLKGKISDLTLPAHIITVALLPKDAKGAVVAELLPEPVPSTKTAGDEKIPLEAILYHQLIEIWMEILKVPSLTVEDNFFVLGGSSLLALRMMTQVERLCGRSLPLSLLLTGATISNLARYIVQANNESADPLVIVQPRGDKQPLFFLHGDWAGGGFYCGRLAQQLGEDQPFYVLPPWRSGRQSVSTLQEMAAYHIAAIRKQKPKGPYLLGGYCIGATVAMEMARQLVAGGEKVAHLLLIDPPFWSPPLLRVVWPMVDRLGDLQQWDLQKKIYYFDRYGVSFARWLRKPMSSKFATITRRLGFAPPVVANPITAGIEPGAGEVEILNSIDYAVYFLAYRLYKSRPLAASATLFFPEETPPLRQSWVQRTSRRASFPVHVEILPGDHHTCITKYTPALIEKMKKAISGAETSNLSADR